MLNTVLKKKPFSIFVLLSLLLCLGLGLLWLNHGDPQKSQPHVDAYMSNVIATHYNDDGYPIERATIQHWQHLSNKPYTLLNHPNVQLIQPDGSEWHLSSVHGKSAHTKLEDPISTIDLNDNVLITFKNPDQQSWQLSTEAITLNSKAAHTAAPVRFEGSQGYIEAVGLKAELESGYVEFLNAVKTFYVLESVNIQ